MTRIRALLFSAVALASGCTGGGEDLALTRSSPPPVQPLAVLRFDDEGRTRAVSLDVDTDMPVAIHVDAPDELCFRIEEAGVPARRALLDVFTNPPPQITLQRLRCITGTPHKESSEHDIEVTTSPQRTPPDSGRLQMRFIITSHSRLWDNELAQKAVLDALIEKLSSVDIQPELVQVDHIEGTSPEILFSELEAPALEELLGLASTAEERVVDVVFAGCLRRVDALGRESVVEGYTSRVGGGGAGLADAIFLPGSRCVAPRFPSRDDSARAIAHILAHELGHYLGLQHTEDKSLIMHHNPSLESATRFTPEQAHTMRSHPFIMP